MNKLIALVAGLAVSAVFVVSSAHAEVASCSAAGEHCQSQVKLKTPASQLAAALNVCAAAVQECKARCNGKTSVYFSKFNDYSTTTRSCK